MRRANFLTAAIGLILLGVLPRVVLNSGVLGDVSESDTSALGGMASNLMTTVSWLALFAGVCLLVTAITTMAMDRARFGGRGSAPTEFRGLSAVGVSSERAEVESRSSHEARHARIEQRHEKLVGAYSDFLFDPILAFRYPLLNDVRCTKTASFIDALTSANQLSIEEGILSPDMLDEYERRVDRLVTAWDLAETNARRVGLDEIPPGVREDVERSIRLLEHALDASTTEAERDSYLTKAAELAASAARAGYIVIAAETAQAIGHETLLQLTAGSGQSR